jgi:murein DD-endopeptidase MepM/ murein hydrolase activator NlpD
MRHAIATTILLAAATAGAHGCPSVARSERPQFSHPAAGEIVRGFGTKTDDRLNVDTVYAAAAGDPVRAAGDGEVSDVRSRGSGLRITLRHAQGFATAYAPMSEVAVQTGDCVSAGDIIGRVGAPLHFEMMINGRLLDPIRMRGGLPAR